MTPRYRLASAAESDLSQILQYISGRDGVTRALRVHAKFVEAFDSLAAMPKMGSVRRSLTGDRVRWYRVHHWMVLYDAQSHPVLVLRVIHGARDVEQLLMPD